jgi:alpha-1,2-mannosyltransferase
VAVAALVLAVALDVGATAALAHAMGPANDLFPRWYGARAWLLQGLDPYGAAVDVGIRQAMGSDSAAGSGGPQGAFVFGFVYPGYVALLLAPLALLPFPWAATLWLLLAQVATGAGALLCWRAAELEAGWAPASALPALLAALCFPASLFNLTFGQFAALVFLALAGAWYLLARARGTRWGRDQVAAGVLLALAAVKPSLALLPVATLLLWGAAQGRGRAVAACLIATAFLAAASVLALPGWPVSFWRSTGDYARVAGATSAAGLTADLLGRALGVTPGLFLRAGVAALALVATGAGWWRSPRRAGAALAAGVLLGAWLVPPLYEWNSVLLLVPLLTWLRRLWAARPAGHRPGLAVLLLAGVATLPLITRWPSESRALWPALVLAGWVGASLAGYPEEEVAVAGRPGTKKATLRAGVSPSSPTLT